jgi:hypothetical protein
MGAFSGFFRSFVRQEKNRLQNKVVVEKCVVREFDIRRCKHDFLHEKGTGTAFLGAYRQSVQQQYDTRLINRFQNLHLFGLVLLMSVSFYYR